MNDLACMACSGIQSWQQSLLLKHASADVKWQLADAQLKQEIRCLEKDNSEQDATDILMQLTGAAASCTSSLSTPGETE